MDSPLRYFAELRDPRVERTREHLLEEIVAEYIANRNENQDEDFRVDG